MAEQLRRRLAFLALVVSSLALLATSPPSGTLRTVEGESVVGPGRPAAIDIRFRVSDVRQAVHGVDVRLDVPRQTTDRALQVDAAIRVNGVPIELRSNAVELGEGSCADGCTVDVHVDLTVVGPPAPDATIRWSIGLFVNAGSPDAVTIAASTEHPPGGPDRFLWYVLGLGMGVLAGLGMYHAGSRFQRFRLGLAAASLAVAAWFLLYGAGGLAYALLNIGFGLDFVSSAAALIPVVLLGVAIVVGLIRHLRGQGLWLAVAGWIYLLLALLAGFAEVADPPSYRPLELVLLGLCIVAPGAAAVTSPRLLPPDRISSVGEVIVTTSQVLLIAGNGLIVAGLLPSALAYGFGGGGGQALEGLAGFFVLIATFLVLIWGLRRWRRGARVLLVTANTLLLLPLGLLVFFAWAVLDYISVAALVPPIVLMAASLIGVIGGATVTPRSAARSAGDGVSPGPGPSEQDGDHQRGQDDEVGRVGDEGDGLEVRQGG